MKSYKIGFSTAISLVIANMIGTGVFTSLGFQLADIKTPFAILTLWVLGGIIAFCGALTYGEIGTALPRSGGEYNYLSKLYHPVVGFMSGWVSITVGFAAPVALAAMAFGAYTNSIFSSVPAMYSAIVLVILLTALHATDVKAGSRFQVLFTLLKLGIILIFIIAGFLFSPNHSTVISPGTQAIREIFSPAFAVSLIYVSYAYSGWNAAAYIAGELKQPEKNLPRSLLIGTALVMLVYTLLNYVFMYSVPSENLVGNLEVGVISARAIFGPVWGNLMGLVISLLLISTISAMIMAGPRIIQVMGEDLGILNFFSKVNSRGVPFVAVIMQSLITVILILTSGFEAVLTFVGFSISLFTVLTVAGIFILRFKGIAAPYRIKWYPFPPLIFLILNLWIMIFVFKSKPLESSLGLLNVFIGALVWMAAKKFKLTKS